MDEKSYENTLIYDVLCKTLIGVKPLRYMFTRVDWFIKGCDGTKYLELFIIENYNAICYKIRYLLRLKKGVTYLIFHIYAKVKFGSDDDFPLEERLILDSVITLIKSVFNKNKNHCYDSILLENWIKTFDNIIILRFGEIIVVEEDLIVVVK